MSDEKYSILGGDGYRPAPEEVTIETIERCRVCERGFKTRWGRISSCKEHEFLEETTIPTTFSHIKKGKVPQHDK